MKKTFSCAAIAILLCCSHSFAQTKQKSQDSEAPINFTKIEKFPEFPGGNPMFIKFLQTNLKYPDQAKSKKLEGKVFIEFIVEKDGAINDIKVARGIGGGCDEEAVRVLKASPKWHPGMQKGRPVKVKYTVPIAFKL